MRKRDKLYGEQTHDHSQVQSQSQSNILQITDKFAMMSGGQSFQRGNSFDTDNHSEPPDPVSEMFNHQVSPKR